MTVRAPSQGRWFPAPLAVFLCAMSLRAALYPSGDERLYAALTAMTAAYLIALLRIYPLRRWLGSVALGGAGVVVLAAAAPAQSGALRQPLQEPIVVDSARVRYGAFFAQGHDARGQCVEVNGWPYWITRGDALYHVEVREPSVRRQSGCWRAEWTPGSQLHRSAFRTYVKDPVIAAYGVGAGGYLLALTWGDRSLLDRRWSQQFAAAGTAHLVAVSGTHFIFVAAVLWVVLGMVLWPLFLRESPWLNHSRTLRILALIGLMGAYAYIAGDTGAVLRAYIMAALALALPMLLHRRIPMTVVLAWMGFAMAVGWPAIWQGLGMQLSFWITLAIILVAEARHSLLPWVLYALLAVVPTAASILILWSAGIPTAWNGALNNVIAIPVFEAFIMPAAWLAAGCADLGLVGPGRVLADVAVRLTDALLVSSVPPGYGTYVSQALDIALAGAALAVAFGTIMSSTKSSGFSN